MQKIKQIVINIHKDIYDDIKANNYIFDEYNKEVTEAISEGTPLEDIKAEIERVMNDESLADTQVQAFAYVLQIIDKFTGIDEKTDGD